MRHYLLYGHGGSYNHGAEAIVRSTVVFLRKMSPGCKISLSTHYAEQDREFSLPVDDFVERDMRGKSNSEIYSPTIERITPKTICIHVGGDNYCYNGWQRWTMLHYASLEYGAKSILWSCSIEPDVINSEMLRALRTHHLVTAREIETYNALIGYGLTNVVKVSDIAFMLEVEPVELLFDDYVVVNISPLIISKNPLVLAAFQRLVKYLLDATDMNIALVPHVLQIVDNDYDALQNINFYNSKRIWLVSDKLNAAQYKYIISSSRFCVAARTHAAIAAYSSCVPVLAIGYSTKAKGIAKDLDMSEYVIDVSEISNENDITYAFRLLMNDEEDIKRKLLTRIPKYICDSINVQKLGLIR
jgi:polysaccharide pyruvyl transferase WcaK-like protein